MSLDLPRTLTGGKSAPSRTFDFGGPVPPDQRGTQHAEQYYIGDDNTPLQIDKKKPKANLASGKFVKNISAKLKKEKRAGVSQQVAVPDHQEKLTKNGKKKIVTAVEQDDKAVPHVQHTKDVDYATGTKRKNAPPPRKRSLLRKTALESGPVQKKQRRVSAHQV